MPRITPPLARLIVPVLAASALAACEPAGIGGRGGARACVTSESCDLGERCVDGVCEAPPPVADAGALGSTDDPRESSGPVPEERVDEEPPPAPEPGATDVCGNGVDDDGDGSADEQCSCEIGAAQRCFGGDPALAGVGACELGTQRCGGAGEFGSWGACADWVPPTDELCDGLDNDCDGTADEGCECAFGATRACYVGPEGTADVGACAPGAQACVAGEWADCEGSLLPAIDRCDGADNDCDGVVDEGCLCAPGETRGCFESPSGAPAEGTPGLGQCRAGQATCVEGPAGGSDFGRCAGAVTASPEICRNDLDEDCDGAADEGCAPPVVDCTVADVLFLMDTTGSMAGEINQIQQGLRSVIIPGLSREIADVRFAVARFDDFAVGDYGSSGDVPFQSLLTTTSSVTDTQSAVNQLFAAGGGDEPESQVEALYQVATGAGVPGRVPARSCTGGVGYPCFRPEATPIILLFTDANFHNGPGGANAYPSWAVAGAHRYDEAVAALTGIHAKVLGLMSGRGAQRDLEAIARDTGAVASDGAPIVFDIGEDGRSLSDDVVRAIQTLCR